MGAIQFQLPGNLPGDFPLDRASMTGGQDNMPYKTAAIRKGTHLRIERAGDESGCLMAPWNVEGTGQLMVSTATLIERPALYHLAVELARGKVNRLRNQAFDWLTGGLQMPPDLFRTIREASMQVGKAVAQSPSEEAYSFANAALASGHQAAEQLVQAYISQVFHVRHQRQPRLDTHLICRLGAEVPPTNLAAPLRETFTAVRIPFSWNLVEPAENDFRWEPFDALVSWALKEGLPVMGGPLIDFSASQLPDWLWQYEGNLSSLVGYMAAFIEAAINRYKGRIRNWQLTTAGNCANVLSLGEEELLWLAIRLTETARGLQPDLELVAGIAQPWGDYLKDQDRVHSAFVFADTLMRSNLNLAAIDLEIVMGVSPRGSYCRDLLDTSRLLDLYALLGIPLQVTLGYPSARGVDPLADSSLKAQAGWWHGGLDEQTQADWATAFAGLATCKPYMRNVQWVQFSDGEPHQFPHAGLVDSQGKLKPSLERLRELRHEHLRNE